MPKRKPADEPAIIITLGRLHTYTESELREAAVIHQQLGRGTLFLAPADDGPLNLEPDEE